MGLSFMGLPACQRPPAKDTDSVRTALHRGPMRDTKVPKVLLTPYFGRKTSLCSW